MAEAVWNGSLRLSLVSCPIYLSAATNSSRRIKLDLLSARTGNPVSRSARAAATVFLAQDNARKTLEAGVTTVRDLGSSGYSDIAMRDLIAAGKMRGPRMFVAGYGDEEDAAHRPSHVARVPGLRCRNDGRSRHGTTA